MEGLRIPTTSGSTEEVEVGMSLRMTVIIRDSLDGDEEAGDKPRRTNSTRERCREEIPALEDRLAAICEETTQLEELIKLKHSCRRQGLFLRLEGPLLLSRDGETLHSSSSEPPP